MLEFLARVLDHVPDPGQQLLRYWGWYSNAARGRRDQALGTVSVGSAARPDPCEAKSRQRRLTWSQLIRKVYEIDPLLCPYCGSQLRIAVPPVVLGAAFVVDWVRSGACSPISASRLSDPSRSRTRRPTPPTASPLLLHEAPHR